MNKSLFKKLACFAILLLVGFIFFLRQHVYSPNFSMTLEFINILGITEFVLLVLQLFYFVLLLCYSYYLYKSYSYYTRILWDFDLLSNIFIYLLLLLSVVFVLPCLYYFNGLMLFSGIFSLNASDIFQTVPEMKFSDFWSVCMNGNPPKSNAPDMGGHVVAAGIHNDKNYVCIDVVQAIHKGLKESTLAKQGAFGFKATFRVADVVCSGLDPSEIPRSSSSLKNS